MSQGIYGKATNVSHMVIQCIHTVVCMCITGKVFWTIDTSIVHFAWNFYNPLIMPDFTLDGVPEVLFSHGGDNQFVAKVRRLS